MSIENPKCETCRWYYPSTPPTDSTQEQGECRKKPPVVMSTPEYAHSAFPSVYPADFCGEHSVLRVSEPTRWPVNKGILGDPLHHGSLGGTAGPNDLVGTLARGGTPDPEANRHNLLGTLDR